MKKLRKRVHQALDFEKDDLALDRFVGFAILSLIALNVVAVIVESIPGIYRTYRVYFDAFELFSLAVFTLEYLLRIWSCVEERAPGSPMRERLRYLVSPLGLIDLMAILPFYLSGGLDPFQGLQNSMRSARVFRLFALFRVLKISRYSRAFTTLGRVIQLRREELVISAALGSMLLLCSSALMYLLERQANPDDFSSIPKSMWWGITTLTTVGYGDSTPTTPTGKLVAGFIQILGLVMFAIPAGVLAGGFSDELQRQRHEAGDASCPHCGGSLRSR